MLQVLSFAFTVVGMYVAPTIVKLWLIWNELVNPTKLYAGNWLATVVAATGSKPIATIV
jgi:hypothetical protein